MHWFSPQLPSHRCCSLRVKKKNKQNQQTNTLYILSFFIYIRLINHFQPGTCRINKSTMPFKIMENIGSFLSACSRLGVSDADMFQTVDLYEAKNMSQVLQTLSTLRRITGWGTSAPVANQVPLYEGSKSQGSLAPAYGTSSSYSSTRTTSSPRTVTSPSPRTTPSSRVGTASPRSSPAPAAASSSSTAPANKFCTECGTKTVPGAKFCGNCGHKL